MSFLAINLNWQVTRLKTKRQSPAINILIGTK